MNLTPEQIEKYSKLMAEFLDLQPWYRKPSRMRFHLDWNWLHRVWEKFRDLKFKESDTKYYDHLYHCESIRTRLTDHEIKYAFLELGNAIEWYFKQQC